MGAPTTVQWIRQAGQRIATGSARRTAQLATGALRLARNLWRRAASWLGEASGLSWVLRLAVLLASAMVVRKVAVAVAGAVYARVESGQAWWLLWGATIAWTVAAYRAGREDWQPEQSAEPALKPAAPVAEAAEEQPAESAPAGPLLPNILDLRISLSKVGTPHAHLAVLAEDIGTTPERVREALAKWQVPVEPVRMRGRGSSTGVKGGPDVHPSLAPRSDDVAVVGADQPANNDNNNAAFETVPDEENPHRTRVRWLAK